MFVLSNLIIAVAKIVSIFLTLAYWAILLRALISWVSPDPYNQIVQMLHKLTEPVLQPIRRKLPPMGVDLSPIIAFVVIIFLQSFLVKTLYDIAYALRG
ncbi:MAG: YggT family protein [Lysobacterales bacterium]|jgi:YggT family protein